MIGPTLPPSAYGFTGQQYFGIGSFACLVFGLIVVK